MRPRPHADRQGRGASARGREPRSPPPERPACRSSSRRAGCSGRCARTRSPPGITEPVVCYQGAVVADPVGGEFLRHVPHADGGGSGGDRRDGRPRPHGALLRRRRALRRSRDAGVRRLRELPEPHRPRRRRPRRVARAAADEARHRRRAGGDGRARGRDEGAVRRPALHREVSPPLPRVRRTLGDEGRGARVCRRAAGLRSRGNRRVRRRGERRRADSSGPATASPSPTHTSARWRSRTMYVPPWTRRA